MSEMPPPTANYASGQQMKPHRGVLILVFGILGFVVCVIFGILAWTWGNNDLKEMDAGLMDPEGRGLTNAGRIIGMVNCILVAVFIVLWLLMLMCGIGASVVQSS